MLAPRLVKPLAALVGLPAARLGGSAGRLARENSVRNPGRTASTAAALMIGLALVTVVATLGAGLRGSTEDGGQASRSTPTTSSPPRTAAARSRPRPTRPSPAPASSRLGRPLGHGQGRRRRAAVTGIDAEDDRPLLHASSGQQGSLAGLDDGGAIVTKGFAEASDLKVGSALDRAVLERREARAARRRHPRAAAMDPLLGDVAITQQRVRRRVPAPAERCSRSSTAARRRRSRKAIARLSRTRSSRPRRSSPRAAPTG